METDSLTKLSYYGADCNLEARDPRAAARHRRLDVNARNRNFPRNYHRPLVRREEEIIDQIRNRKKTIASSDLPKLKVMAFPTISGCNTSKSYFLGH